MFKYIDSLIIDDPDPCVMIIYDDKNFETANWLDKKKIISNAKKLGVKNIIITLDALR